MKSEGKTLVVDGSTQGKLAVVTRERAHSVVPPGSLRIKGLYSSITFKDFLVAAGRHSLGTTQHRGLGTDYVGVVQETRSDTFEVGDLVWVVGTSLGSGSTGGLCEFLVVDETLVMSLPPGWTPLSAAGGGTPLLTASLAWLKILRALGNVPKSIAISGVGGSVGGFALDIARQNNLHRIFAISSRPSIERRAQFDSRVELISPNSLSKGSKFKLLPERWDCGIDVLGGETVNGMLKATRSKGVVIALGMVLDETATINLAPFFLRSVILSGLNLESEITHEYAELCRIAGPVVSLLPGSLEVRPSSTSEIQHALVSREAGNGEGRTVFDLLTLSDRANL